MTFDSSARVTSSFSAARERGALGAATPTGQYDQTWAWDRHGVDRADTGRRSAHLPGQGAGLGYDPIREEVVLFGGWDGTTTLADTWVWDGTSWSPRVTQRLCKRDTVMDHSMAYDEARQKPSS